MRPWHGHPDTTRQVLESLLLHSLSEATPTVTEDERAFFTACEFWAATANHSLGQYLGRVPAARLKSAELVFARIGADVVVAVVHRARESWRLGAGVISMRSICANIETQLEPVADQVDDALLRFATHICTSQLAVVVPVRQFPALRRSARPISGRA